MFKEIERILTNTGTYICVTLAESYILETLLSFFTNTSTSTWNITIEIIETIKASPFKAFFFFIQKSNTATTTTTTTTTTNATSSTIDLYVDNMGNRMTSCQAVRSDTAMSTILSIQEFHQFDMGALK